MKHIAKWLACAGLIAMVGCTSDSADRHTVAQKPPKVQPSDDEPPVERLVPIEQLNDKNANAQADALYRDMLKDSRREPSATSTASAVGDQPTTR